MSDEFTTKGPSDVRQGVDYSTSVGDILTEANGLINGDRQKDYGPPDQNFKNIAAFWNIRFQHLLAEGKEFSPSDVAIAMLLLKVARDIKGYKRDSAVDGAAYQDLYAYLNEKGL